MTIQELQEVLATLPAEQRLHLAGFLIQSLQGDAADESGISTNALLPFVGMFSADNPDVAEQAEAILANDVNPVSGFGG